MLPAVDIVLPCYNPNEKWHLELLNFHEENAKYFELRYLIVNDGSNVSYLPDQIRQLREKKIPLKFLSYETNKGKGFALRTGVTESKAGYLVYTDIDFPFTNASTRHLITRLLEGACDVVAGYREETYYGNKMSGFRRFLSKSFRFFIKGVLKLTVTDTQCGLKGFNEKGRQKFLATKTNRYLFDFEFIYTVCKDSSLNIQTVPVQLKDNVVFRKMKLSILLQEMLNLVAILIFRKR